MAQFRVEGIDDVLKRLEKLSDRSKIDAIAKKAVNEAKNVVCESTKSAVRASEKGPYSTGSIAASIEVTDARINSYGVFVVARPTGRDDRGVRNGEKAAYLEYGKYSTTHMEARPWRANAVSNSEAKAKEIIENVVTKEMQLE